VRCLKRAEKQYQGHDAETVRKRKEYFDGLWKHAFGHYTRKECPGDCPCNQFYGPSEALSQQDLENGESLAAMLDLDQAVIGNSSSGEIQIEAEEVDPDVS